MKAGPIALGTYNPSQVPKATLLAEYTARRTMLSDLLGILRANAPGEPCQHSLLIGPRGFGKTTSLFALKYNLEDDANLAAEWVPLLFDEENYQIADLAGFWLECLRLAEATFDVTTERRYPALNVSRDPKLESLAQEAFLELLDRHHRRALLLIDNINDILAVVSDEREQHRLRAVLLEESRVCVVGTASTYFEAIQNTDQPFYNLFRTFRLDRFSPEEMKAAVEAMAKARSSGEGVVSLPESKGYWKGLHILTGGNPRLVKMVFQLMEQGVTPDFRSQLEGLLDAYTPYFKHRIEAMSPQQRRVFDAIALAWDPVQIGDIAPSLRMESNQISAQISSLTAAQLVAIAGGSAKRRTYQIADRFSNIYYFMRYSRGGRSKFEWFVLTMKAILTPEQFRLQLDRMRTMGLACGEDTELRERAHLLVSATHALDDPRMRRAEAHKTVAAFLNHSQESALRHLLDDPEMSEILAEEHAAVRFFAELPRKERERVNYQPDKAEWWSQLGELATTKSLWPLAEAAERKAIDLEPSNYFHWYNLGFLLKNHLQRFEEAESAFRKAIERNSSSPFPWLNLGDLYVEQYRRPDEAEAAYKKATQSDHFKEISWSVLGEFLANHRRRLDEAEAAHRKAIEIAPADSYAWGCMGSFLADHTTRFEEAESAFRKAVVLEPTNSRQWFFLGNFLARRLQRFDEAERALRKAEKLDPSNPIIKRTLAEVLFRMRRSQAEAAALATDALLTNLKSTPAQLVFREVALAEPHSAMRVVKELSELLAQPGSDLGNGTGQLYSLALDCIISLLRANREDEVLSLIERTETRDIFDVPLRAIEVRRDPTAKAKLATERLALVEAFLEQVGASPASEAIPASAKGSRRRKVGA